MANQGMIYAGEREEADFTMDGTEHIHTFTESYSVAPEVKIDEYSGSGPGLSWIVTATNVTITGDNDATGHITVVG